MNIPKEAIEKAIAGGWKYRGGEITFWQKTALDSTFWQALQVAIYDPHKTSQVHWRTLALDFCRLVLIGKPTDDFWQDLLN